MSEPDQGAAAAAAAVAPRHRRACSLLNAGCPKPVSVTSPCYRRAALSGAALRFSARGDSVRYLYSILLARQQRLLSLFTAGGRPRRQCGGGPGPARRLDGIPLALQLAAVLPGSPSLDQLNQRLGLTTADERP